MKLFLSHSNADKQFARSLASDLQINGIDVWYDEWELNWGDSLTEKIEKGITESSFLVAVISKNSIRSKWVSMELKAALATEISRDSVFILPVVIDNCEVPLFLRDKLYIDFQLDYKDGIDKVLNAIERFRGKPAYLKPLINRILQTKEELSQNIVITLADNLNSLNLNPPEYQKLLQLIIRTDAFLLPFIQHGLRYYTSTELLKLILSIRTLPHPEHFEFTYQLAEGTATKDIYEYAGFPPEEVNAPLEEPTSDEERIELETKLDTTDLLGPDHKSRVVLEVLQNLYQIGNQCAMDIIWSYAGFSFRALTPSLELLLMTGNVKALTKYLSRLGSFDVSQTTRKVIYGGLAKLSASRREYQQLLTTAFASSQSHAQFRLLEHIDAFDPRVAKGLCRIGKCSDNGEIKQLSIAYLVTQADDESATASKG